MAKSNAPPVWMPREIEHISIADLKARPRNPRKVDQDTIDMIVKGLGEYGWPIPILIDEKGAVIVGEEMLAAANIAGLDVAPAIRAHDWSEARKSAYRIHYAKVIERGEWDVDILRQELQAIEDAGLDLTVTGFDPDELSRMLANMDDPEEAEETPELLATPVTQPGDMWEIGAHRIICGDSTSATDVERVLAGSTPHLMVTDPPYGVEYDANWRNERIRENGRPPGARAIGKVLNDDRADWREAWALFPGDVAYVWHASLFTADVLQSLEAVGFQGLMTNR